MPATSTSDVLQYLHTMVLPLDGGERTDGQLLRDYLGGGEAAALAALVRRHGPMVWDVCRRTLRHFNDAEREKNEKRGRESI
jgi:hypothetical protein